MNESKLKKFIRDYWSLIVFLLILLGIALFLIFKTPPFHTTPDPVWTKNTIRFISQKGAIL